MNRFAPILAVLWVALAGAALAADADLTSRRHRLRGDLATGDVDRFAFAAPPGTKLKLKLEAQELELDVRLLGPDGAVALGDTLRIKDDGERLKIANVSLPVAGLYRLEILGTGAGAYEGKLTLGVPTKTPVDVTLPAGGPVWLPIALAPDSTLRRIRIRPRSDGLFVDVASLSDPENIALDLVARIRSRGFDLAPEDEDLEPGLYRLALSHRAGAGTVRIKVKTEVARPSRTLIDLTDGISTDGLPDGDSDATHHEILVRLAKGARREEIEEEYDAEFIEEIAGTGYWRVLLEEEDDEDDLLEDLLEDNDVLAAERNYLVQAPEGEQSSIPVLDDNLDEEQCVQQPSLGRIGVPVAHATTGGAGVVVAVVDTGVDPDHPFLAGRLAPGGFDLVDGDEDPREELSGADGDGDTLIDEGYGHGTFIAGLVLAVAPEARILPIRVLDPDARGDAVRVAEGIVLAVERGAHVINLSLGTTDETRIIREAVKFAQERGVIVVVAAGNEADQITFPARYGNTLAVTAVDAAGVAAEFTNLGSSADLAAPGVDLIGPVPEDAGAAWAVWSGTSFAAPLVSGSTALVLATRPESKGADAANRLLETAESLDALNPEVAEQLGRGLVRPDRALLPD